MFKKEKNIKILNKIGLIEHLRTNGKLTCLDKCKKNRKCSFVIYDGNTCKLFDNEQNNQLIDSNKSDAYFKDLNL